MDNYRIMDAKSEEIKDGYIFNYEKSVYECLLCNETFEVGRIYDIGGELYEAFRAVKEHIKLEHNSVLDNLLAFDKKFTGLTENQKSLLTDIANGLSDKEIANKNNTSPATVRHQRFKFREKAKQAKLYLAIYESVEAFYKLEHKKELVKPHSGATMVDERYIITNEEEEKILRTYFEAGENLKLKAFPAKEKRKITVLKMITSKFEKGRKYTEKEVNEILKSIYPEDIATIRRYLIQYGFLERTNDCRSYWIKQIKGE